MARQRGFNYRGVLEVIGAGLLSIYPVSAALSDGTAPNQPVLSAAEKTKQAADEARKAVRSADAAYLSETLGAMGSQGNLDALKQKRAADRKSKRDAEDGKYATEDRLLGAKSLGQPQNFVDGSYIADEATPEQLNILYIDDEGVLPNDVEVLHVPEGVFAVGISEDNEPIEYFLVGGGGDKSRLKPKESTNTDNRRILYLKRFPLPAEQNGTQPQEQAHEKEQANGPSQAPKSANSHAVRPEVAHRLSALSQEITDGFDELDTGVKQMGEFHERLTDVLGGVLDRLGEIEAKYKALKDQADSASKRADAEARGAFNSKKDSADTEIPATPEHR